METAIEIYEKNKNCSINIMMALGSFSKSYNENLFNELAKGFFEEEPLFDSLLEAYIRKNENAFSD